MKISKTHLKIIMSGGGLKYQFGEGSAAQVSESLGDRGCIC